MYRSSLITLLLAAIALPLAAADVVVIESGTASVNGDLAVSGGVTIAGSVQVTEVSDDGTLADASSSAVPTEQAVKAYVDANAPAFLDEDDMASNSDTAAPTQQSVRPTSTPTRAVGVLSAIRPTPTREAGKTGPATVGSACPQIFLAE